MHDHPSQIAGPRRSAVLIVDDAQFLFLLSKAKHGEQKILPRLL